MALWKSKSGYPAKCVRKFQSLFFWMALWKGSVVPCERTFTSFNPCFSGWRSESFLLGKSSSLSSSFNPCFSGWRSESIKYPGGVRDDYSFNPCFSGWRSERAAMKNYISHLWGFNPCFSGWRSERIVIVSVVVNVPEFQSLFFWMALWKAIDKEPPRTKTEVSILVFLDGALKVSRKCCICSFKRSFNPCFSGWRSERARYILLCHRLQEFQSLFFWMALWKSVSMHTHPATSYSFNPCFSGWRSERMKQCPFQARECSFNPCFSGWRSERVVQALAHLRPVLEFQSLFFWMALWKQSRRSCEVWKEQFQSLFFWMALWKN